MYGISNNAARRGNNSKKLITRTFMTRKEQLERDTIHPQEWIVLTKQAPRPVVHRNTEIEAKLPNDPDTSLNNNEFFKDKVESRPQISESSFMRLHELLSVPSLNLEVIRMYITTYPMNALNQRNDAGDLPLHIALKRPEPESIIICELLNRFPASAREKDSTGNLPLFLACRNPKTSYGVVRLLLSIYPQAAKVKVFGSLALHTMFYAGNSSVDIARMLLSVNADAARTPNFHGNLPLHYICASSLSDANLDIVRMLLSRYKDGVLYHNKEGDTPLSRALKSVTKQPYMLPLTSNSQNALLNYVHQAQSSGAMKIIRDLLNSANMYDLEPMQQFLRSELNWNARKSLIMCTVKVMRDKQMQKGNGDESDGQKGFFLTLMDYNDVWRKIICFL